MKIEKSTVAAFIASLAISGMAALVFAAPTFADDSGAASDLARRGADDAADEPDVDGPDDNGDDGANHTRRGADDAPDAPDVDDPETGDDHGNHGPGHM